MCGPAFADTSLCQDGERIWFAAQAKDSGQLVSLCGSEPENGYITWLQFRMGTKDKLALAWPKERKRPNRIFNVRRYTR